MAVRVSELRGSERCPVIGQTEVASPRWDKITSPETELTSRWCSNSRTFVEPMSEAKQMTAAQAAGAASHTMVVFLHRRASWPQTSIEKVLFDVEYSRVLVFQGGVIECSSRMTGNCQVRFLEGWPPAMGAGYSAHRAYTETGCHRHPWAYRRLAYSPSNPSVSRTDWPPPEKITGDGRALHPRCSSGLRFQFFCVEVFSLLPKS